MSQTGYVAECRDDACILGTGYHFGELVRVRQEFRDEDRALAEAWATFHKAGFPTHEVRVGHFARWKIGSRPMAPEVRKAIFGE